MHRDAPRSSTGDRGGRVSSADDVHEGSMIGARADPDHVPSLNGHRSPVPFDGLDLTSVDHDVNPKDSFEDGLDCGADDGDGLDGGDCGDDVRTGRKFAFLLAVGRSLGDRRSVTIACNTLRLEREEEFNKVQKQKAKTKCKIVELCDISHKICFCMHVERKNVALCRKRPRSSIYWSSSKNLICE